MPNTSNDASAASAIDPLDTGTDTNQSHHSSNDNSDGGTLSAGSRKSTRAIPPMNFPDPPSASTKGLPPTIDNLEFLLRQHGITVRFNMCKKGPEIRIPGTKGLRQNQPNVARAKIVSIAARHGIPSTHMEEYLLEIADRNAFHPVRNWIDGKPWDEQPRIAQICNTITVAEGYPEQLKNTLVRKWLLSAVAAVCREDSFKTRGVLTLQGAQGLGKTTWFAKLVPDAKLRDEVVKLGHHIDGGNKDSKLEAIRHWIVEVGELESSFKRDISRLKGFLTDDYDKIRPPYARVEAEYPRQTVFGASVNDPQFLRDATGNSRFWTIAVEHIDYTHDIDMQQVFAELRSELDAGAQWWLTQAEETALEMQNRNHREISAVAEMIMPVLDLSKLGDDRNPRMTASDLLTLIGIRTPTNAQSKECNSFLREYVGAPKRSGNNYWLVPLSDHTRMQSNRPWVKDHGEPDDF